MLHSGVTYFLSCLRQTSLFYEQMEGLKEGYQASGQPALPDIAFTYVILFSVALILEDCLLCKV